jgi:hypothetical protein
LWRCLIGKNYRNDADWIEHNLGSKRFYPLLPPPADCLSTADPLRTTARLLLLRPEFSLLSLESMPSSTSSSSDSNTLSLTAEVEVKNDEVPLGWRFVTPEAGGTSYYWSLLSVVMSVVMSSDECSDECSDACSDEEATITTGWFCLLHQWPCD